MNKLLLLAGCLLLSASCRQHTTTDQRPNVLWVIAEDLSPDLGCYGDQIARTPHLDQFAGENAMFTNCFATGPVCSASRSALITGMYQTSIGAQNHRTLEEYKPELPQGIRILPYYLRQAGYFTVLCSSGDKKKSKSPSPLGTGKTDFNFKYDETTAFDGSNWDQRKKGQPFFGYLTLLTTHRGKWWDHLEERVRPGSIQVPPQYPDNDTSRKDLATYYNAISGIDDLFARIITRLKTEGIYDNTIVIFTSDHGRPMPRGKQFCYDEGTRVPLLIHAPGIYGKGFVSDRLVSSIDITATILDMCGIDIPKHFQGVSFKDPDKNLRKFVISARDRCDETVMRIRSVRDDSMRYIRNFDPEIPYTAVNRYKDTRYPILINMRNLHKEGKLSPVQELFFADRRPEEELYDCINDPQNLVNLADDPQYKDKLEVMRKRLETWLEKYPDMGRIKEGKEVMDKIMKERVSKYGY